MARVIATKGQQQGRQIPQTERKAAQGYEMKNGKGSYGKKGNKGAMSMPGKNGKSKTAMAGNPKKMKKGKM